MAETQRFLRYLAPNLVTTASIVFGLLSLVASFEGRHGDAAWFVMFSVLTDKLDGLVARLLKASTEFGVQMDSLADFLSFGIAPAVLWFTYLSNAPGLYFHGGPGLVILAVSSVVWVLCVVVRLARYNVVEDDPRCRRLFFGVPTTLMAGALVMLFLTGLKYAADAELRARAEVSFDEARLLGGLEVGYGFFGVWPAFMVVGAFLMVSTLKNPKLGLTRYKALTAFVFVNVLSGYATGFSRHFPELLAFQAITWISVSLCWGLTARGLRGLRAPPLFPQRDLAPHERPHRPEDDLLPDDADELDERAEDDGTRASRPAS